jgi:parallel beta-helix repeat protein
MDRFASVIALLALAACDAPNRLAAPPELSADRLGGADITVHAGGSIQAAVTAAAPGTVIRIEPGTYAEAIHVSTAGLRLVGARGHDGSGVVIKNPGGKDQGIAVDPGSNGFALVNVVVQGFAKNGVFLDGVDGFLLSRVTAQDNGEYGLFPVHSSHGVIERCRTSGHNDTGIYVGQSHDIVVRNSVAFANVNGIEFENSQRLRAFGNETYDNVVGILVVLLPGLDVKTTSDNLVADNKVHDNNHVNFAPAGDLASFVPTGSGILVIGAKRTRVERNVITGNRFTGIGVASTLALGALAGLPPSAFADIQPDPAQVRIVDNAVTGNGGAPPLLVFPTVDLLWDGSGTGNCWARNRFRTSFPATLPACRVRGVHRGDED